MKFFTIVFLLTSLSVHAKVKKETWSCEVQGKKVMAAVFTDTTIKATYDSGVVDAEKVNLSFHQARQKSALNGSQKTILKGFTDAGYDQYSYKITLIRTIHSDFSYAGKYNAQALVETYERPSCTEPMLILDKIDCEVEVSEK